MVDNGPETKKQYTQDELDLIERLKWCEENPDKIKWVDGSDILERYAV